MSIRIETHVGREETMKWGPPLSTVVPDIGELPTYDGLKHRTFETRDEATRRPPYAVFESKTVRFAPSSGEHGAEFADPEALLRASRGRRIDDAYRGPVNLAVFASEIPRFAGPIVVTPASTFARDNARARAKRGVPMPPAARALGPGRTTWRHEGVPGLGELRRSSSFADGTLRDMRAAAAEPRGARPAPDDDETRGRGGVESRDDEPEMDALEALEARVRARSTAQPTPPRTPEPHARPSRAIRSAPRPPPERQAPSGPNSRASSRPARRGRTRDIRAY
ncbi:hypothetical protein JL721_3536 [Aureococcus anophagefferens]|nr:hypothetical protein JL721_3536 [Aureococcus anophagefferens]